MTQPRSEFLPALKFCEFQAVTNAGKGSEEMCGLRVVRKGASEKVTFEQRLYLCERNPGSLGLRLWLCELGGRREGSSFRGLPWSLLQVPGPRRQSWPGGGRGRQARPGGDLAPTPVLEPRPRPRVSGSSHQPVGVPSAGARPPPRAPRRPLPHAPHSSPPLTRFFPVGRSPGLTVLSSPAASSRGAAGTAGLLSRVLHLQWTGCPSVLGTTPNRPRRLGPATAEGRTAAAGGLGGSHPCAVGVAASVLSITEKRKHVILQRPVPSELVNTIFKLRFLRA